MPVKVLNPLRPRAFADVQIGELIIDSLREKPILAVVLDKKNDWLLYGILRGEVFDKPTTFVANNPPTLLSYGVGWVLDLQPIGDPTLSYHTVSNFRPGEAVMVDGEVALVFEHREPGGFGGPILFKLESLKIDRGAREAASGFGWAIWRNEAERGRQGAQPILTSQGLVAGHR